MENPQFGIILHCDLTFQHMKALIPRRLRRYFEASVWDMKLRHWVTGSRRFETNSLEKSGKINGWRDIVSQKNENVSHTAAKIEKLISVDQKDSTRRQLPYKIDLHELTFRIFVLRMFMYGWTYWLCRFHRGRHENEIQSYVGYD